MDRPSHFLHIFHGDGDNAVVRAADSDLSDPVHLIAHLDHDLFQDDSMNDRCSRSFLFNKWALCLT